MPVLWSLVFPQRELRNMMYIRKTCRPKSNYFQTIKQTRYTITQKSLKFYDTTHPRECILNFPDFMVTQHYEHYFHIKHTPPTSCSLCVIFERINAFQKTIYARLSHSCSTQSEIDKKKNVESRRRRWIWCRDRIILLSSSSANGLNLLSVTMVACVRARGKNLGPPADRQTETI